MCTLIKRKQIFIKENILIKSNRQNECHMKDINHSEFLSFDEMILKIKCLIQNGTLFMIIRK